jgi:hypothetical protein
MITPAAAGPEKRFSEELARSRKTLLTVAEVIHRTDDFPVCTLVTEYE